MHELTTTTSGLRALREKLESAPVFGLDYETTSSYPGAEAPLEHDKMKVVGFGIGFPDGDRTYVPLAHVSGGNVQHSEALPILKSAVEDKEKIMWSHNLKFERMVTRTLGFNVKNKARDSMLAQYLLGKRLSGGRGLKLKPAVEEFLKHKMLTWEEVVPNKCRAHEVSSQMMAEYGSDDSLQCLRLGEYFSPLLKELDLWKAFIDMECPFTESLVHMQEVGFAIDRGMLLGMNAEFLEEMAELEASFLAVAGVSISSNQQISTAMYDTLRWWPTEGFTRGKSGFYSVDVAHREEVEKKVKKGSPGWVAISLKNRFAKIQKLCSTYTLSLVSKADTFLDGRLRCSFNQTGTATGRLSSSGPNFQNIPSRGEGVAIRRAFIAEAGWKLCVADYSQADLVMMAHLSQDPMLLKAYNEQLDLHGQTAEACGCSRPMGKVTNLGLIYEMQGRTLAGNLGISEIRGNMIARRWHETYPGVKVYHRRMHNYARKYGYVRTITGRIRYLPDINSSNFGKRSRAERESTNTPDQGSVADVIKIAMRNLHAEWRDRGVLYDYWTKEGKAKILSQVHDEMVCEFREDFSEEGMADLQRHMEQAVKLRAPMTAEPGLGQNWLEAKDDSKLRAA